MYAELKPSHQFDLELMCRVGLDESFWPSAVASSAQWWETEKATIQGLKRERRLNTGRMTEAGLISGRPACPAG